jgi:hypothetical protein
MKLVVYLSGKTRKTKHFHTTQDSVAGSYDLGDEMGAKVLEFLNDSYEDYEQLVLAVDGTDIVPHVSEGHIDDLMSDMLGEDSKEYAEFHAACIMNECSTDKVWLVKEDA